MQKQRTGGPLRMEYKAMGIMVEVLVLPGRFSRHRTCGFQNQCVPAEPLLPPDQYHPAMVGYVLSLDFEKSEFPTSQRIPRRRRRSSTITNVDVSLQEYVVLHILFPTNYGSLEAQPS